MFRRLTRQQDWVRQPVLDDAQLQKLITTYFPSNEKRSTRRYVADMTYVFNPDAVARLLQTSGIPYTAAQAKRILVIPMAPGYSRGSPLDDGARQSALRQQHGSVRGSHRRCAGHERARRTGFR